MSSSFLGVGVSPESEEDVTIIFLLGRAMNPTSAVY
ncbi:hypothetical protein CCACVL1_28803 [Corchorus capsularis]|uniref:Uncharacterized protein n=1 Tax=Corchorus capsularis TaxID=210143 RepID=A0A1R3G585_COCAP|nr:hypothetical protein CCACVL1_28803 [Corchorus capsularis]